MSEICACTTPLGNTGTPACKTKYLVVKDLILTPLIGSAGTANTYDVSAGEPLLATIQADLAAADPLDRIYPITGIENVENLRNESIYQEFNSGKKVKVRDGFKLFKGFVPNADPVYVGKVKSAGCSEVGAYRLDAAGSFQFSARKSDGIVDTAYPIEIDSGTFDARFVESTDSEIFGMYIEFQWKETEKDSYLRQVAVDWTASDLDGLIDVSSQNSAIGVSAVTVKLVTDYGDAVTGLLTGDFVLNNLTTVLVEAQTVTETPAASGIYVFALTVPATVTEVIEVVPTKAGFDFTQVVDNTYIVV